jgi:hypothetical protein
LQAQYRCDGDFGKCNVETKSLVHYAKIYLGSLAKLQEFTLAALDKRKTMSKFDMAQDDRMQVLDAYPHMSKYQRTVMARILTWFPTSADKISHAKDLLRNREKDHARRVKVNQRRVTRTHRRQNELRTEQHQSAASRDTGARKKRTRRQQYRDRRIAKEGLSPQSGIPDSFDLSPPEFAVRALARYNERPWSQVFDRHPAWRESVQRKKLVNACRFYYLCEYYKMKYPGRFQTEDMTLEMFEMIPRNAGRMQIMLAVLYFEWCTIASRKPFREQLLAIITSGYLGRCSLLGKKPQNHKAYTRDLKIPQAFVAYYTIVKRYDWIAEWFYDKTERMSITIGDLIASAVVVSITVTFVTPLITYLLTALAGYGPKAKVYVLDNIPTKLMEKLNCYTKTTGIILAQSGENKTSVPKGAKGAVLGDKLEAKLVKQDGSMETLNNAIRMNSYVILSELGVRLGLMTFLEGNIAIVNSHVWEACSSRFKIYSCCPTTGSKAYYELSKKMCSILYNKDDVMHVSMAGTVRQHKNITGYLVDIATIKRYNTPPAAWVLSYDNNTLQMNAEPITDYQYNNSRIKFENSKDFLTDRLQYTWFGAVASTCGTIVCAIINGSCKIVGIHRAGQTSAKLGVAAMVGADIYKKALTQLPEIEAQCGARISLDDYEPGFYSYDHETRCYRSEHKTTAVGQTQFVPTPIQQSGFLGGCPKAPAKLNSTAYAQALMKETLLVNDITCREEVFDIVEEHREIIMEKFAPVPQSKLGGCRTLTFEEAMYGFSDVLDPFDLTTSEGMRLPLLGITKSNLKDPNHPDTLKLKAYVESKIEEFKNGDFTLQMNADCLKDELRDIPRVQANKTRLFNVTDFVDNILIKMALGHLVSKLKRFLLLGPAMCGINPTSSVWSEIYRMFVGLSCVFTDIAGWDHTSAMWLMRVILPWLCKCYGGDPNSFEFKFAAWAYISAMQAVRYNNGFGRRLNRGGSSGNWCTTTFNTWNNHVFHSVAWIYLAKKFGTFTREAYLSTLTLILYSDDNISASTEKFWNVKEMATTFKFLFGINVTSTAKVVITGDTEVQDATIDDADFLSRRFVNRRGIIYAPLSMDSLISQIYYVRSHTGATNEFLMAQLQQNLGNVARELIEYPADEALDLSNKIRLQLKELNLPVVMPYYNYALTRGAHHKLAYY